MKARKWKKLILLNVNNNNLIMNLILTISIGKEYQKITELTHSSIKNYAKKINADFLCIDKQKISQTTPHWEKFQIYNLLDKYDRILYIDTDVIIREDCPDLFKEVPKDKLGMFNEAPFTDRSKELLIDICKQYGIILNNWNGKYYNSGIMVISKKHKNLFKKPEKEIFSFYEQSYINMRIAEEETEIHELHYKFNRMTCIDKFTGEERHNSYIIHYAGYPSLNFLLGLIPRDIEKWKNDKGNYEYKKHIYINVSGGLGDQICAEPAIRYMRKNLYPNDEIIIATHFPRIFKHLEKEGIEICEQGKVNFKMDTPYYFCQSLPGPDTVQWMIVSHLLCHTVDYASIALIKRTLPVLDKQLKFEVSLQDYSNLFDIIGIQDMSDWVAVHCGLHWDSKTFPVSYWQEIIDGLVRAGKKVCLVGKKERGDPPDYKAGARGTVNVKCPEGVIDLREKLNLGMLGALLSKTKVLISNDSAPVHLAGAFDNWIVLIPSCKHPDHILPIRKGHIDYKTLALYKKLIIDEVESRPTQVYPTSVDIKNIDWNNYLIEPKEIINSILNIWD